jgi:ABC-2 type transport system ATP-binding protein
VEQTTIAQEEVMRKRAEPIIITNHLGRHFGDTVAVNGLTLQVYPGEVFGFLGHNGAGKTTTVRLLNGVLTPSSGTARVLGLDPARDGPALRRRTGVLTETPSLDERLTARENLIFYTDLYGVPRTDVSRRVDTVLGSFALADRADEKVGGYSKGMKQRLALARAIIHEPELLFLDEPTSGLDPESARHVHELITHLSHQEGDTVFLCTHNLIEAQKLCDRVAVLRNGQVVAAGTPHELAHRLTHSLSLEIEVGAEGASTALDLLRAAPGITKVTQNNGTITAAGAGREASPDLIAALVHSGVRIYRVAPKEPSLEDVYFALEGEKEALS